MLGIPLGILIGLISGLVAALLTRTAWRTSPNQIKGIVTLTGELLSIPTFWFGGPWVTSKLLSSADTEILLPYYLVSLSCTFVPIAAYPLIKMVIRIGNDIGKAEGISND